MSESGERTRRVVAGREVSTRDMVTALLRPIAAGTILLVGYFLLPINADSDFKLIGFVCGTLLLVAFVGYEIRHFLHSRYPVSTALEMLVAVATFYIVAFATLYFMLSEYDLGSMNERLSRVDALYFSLTVFTTTGFGDIAPDSTGARIVVSVQMISSFILLGLGIRFLTLLVDNRRKKVSD
ncbi:potassium channel family protein [Gordonia oleivorans]|uniref:potassium channel family protein n=1 Tax=Gordonia oleivorans TaxID=3156618 RepID=UPI003CCDEB3A